MRGVVVILRRGWGEHTYHDQAERTDSALSPGIPKWKELRNFFVELVCEDD